MEYNFRDIEEKWQKKWKADGTYKVTNGGDKPKCYVLDMFPYPSGAGLHVGHPLGYIASDIYARYKRLKGFNVLHPMGFDSFGLPAEQYAFETGQHPATTTEKNIATFKQQLDRIGFCYDWDREVRTSDPSYYKWTQWIFLKLYNSYFCNTEQKALPISKLIAKYETKGTVHFTAEEWKAFSEKEKSDWLMKRRLAFVAYGEVNWCEALGTVLANDEVVNGVSERGGHPVEKKKMRQWYLRITAYADRLLQGLETVDFSDAMKEMQRNWIGKSEGAEIQFCLTPNPSPEGEGSETRHFKTANTNTWKFTKEMTRENRKEQTRAEEILWEKIRNNQLGYKVRRQHTVGNFIADFAVLEKYLLIEVDGGYHNDEEQKLYDDARTAYLEELGYTVLRFTNDEVEKDIDAVVTKINDFIRQQGSAPLSGRRRAGGEAPMLKVYTTRPDTIFGVDFVVLAPEHELVAEITTAAQKEEIEKYLTYVKSRSERERLAEVKQVTGAFTGAYAINPFNGREIPIYIAEYVLAGYGTGATMAVPCGDQRDYLFAKHFNIPVTNIIGDNYNGEEANPTKDAVLQNSGFMDGMKMSDAIGAAINKIEEMGIGKRKKNYKMRDAGFSRQRYWGEPFPIIWDNETPHDLPETDLPLELPHVDKYCPGPDGEGPLANIGDWINMPAGKRESSTMPGYAGSSWYFLRYMDPKNANTFCDRSASDYWNQVDVYVGGTEHAVGHLLYSRMWTKVLYDLGLIGYDEPYRKLVNQGMIQGSSRFIYRLTSNNGSNPTIFISANIFNNFQEKPLDEKNKILTELIPDWVIETEFVFARIHAKVDLVDGSFLDIELYKADNNSQYSNAEFILSDYSRYQGKVGQFNYFLCDAEVEKMSKSKYNTVNPDDLCDKYGADTFRMYEMFLGPVEQSKPWDTKGIEGVHRFLRKLWRLFFDETKGAIWTTASAPSPSERAGGEASDAEWKAIYKTIRKIDGDTENFSYNTAVSAFMVCVNELTDLKCHKKEVLEKLLIILAPYAPHISEELWQHLGNHGSVLDAAFPKVEEKYLTESTKDYPVSVNGKLRTSIVFPIDISQEEVEATVVKNEVVQKWLEGKAPKKIIFVKNKMINVVV